MPDALEILRNGRILLEEFACHLNNQAGENEWSVPSNQLRMIDKDLSCGFQFFEFMIDILPPLSNEIEQNVWKKKERWFISQFIEFLNEKGIDVIVDVFSKKKTNTYTTGPNSSHKYKIYEVFHKHYNRSLKSMFLINYMEGEGYISLYKRRDHYFHEEIETEHEARQIAVKLNMLNKQKERIIQTIFHIFHNDPGAHFCEQSTIFHYKGEEKRILVDFNPKTPYQWEITLENKVFVCRNKKEALQKIIPFLQKWKKSNVGNPGSIERKIMTEKFGTYHFEFLIGRATDPLFFQYGIYETCKQENWEDYLQKHTLRNITRDILSNLIKNEEIMNDSLFFQTKEYVFAYFDSKENRNILPRKVFVYTKTEFHELIQRKNKAFRFKQLFEVK